MAAATKAARPVTQTASRIAPEVDDEEEDAELADVVVAAAGAPVATGAVVLAMPAVASAAVSVEKYSAEVSVSQMSAR